MLAKSVLKHDYRMEDVLICVKLFYYAMRIAYVEKALYHYNIGNQNSLMSNIDDSKIEQILSINECIEEFLEKHKCIELYKDSMAQRKSALKIWILVDCINLKKNYFDLYRDQRLSRISLNSVKRRGILFLCDFKLYILAKLIIAIYRKHIQRKKSGLLTS